MGTYFAKIIKLSFKKDQQFFYLKLSVGGRDYGFIRIKTCFGTAVHQLVLGQIELNRYDYIFKQLFKLKIRNYLSLDILTLKRVHMYSNIYFTIKKNSFIQQ